LHVLVVFSDYTGTNSAYGRLIKGVKNAVNLLSQKVVFVEITGDTHGTVINESRETKGMLYIIKGKRQGPQKGAIVRMVAKKLGGLMNVVMVGNGKNDVEALSAVKRA